ncbi:MAG: ThiF family adenylyltransferase [Planctomycetota bacterium]|nr:ThiF family adenylyltransferase [Planctomycetota bacterium]
MKSDRYSRQILFPGIGKGGQEKLQASRVTVIGCGALGTSLCNLLARAGVGYLRIIDRDFVEANNLQRQVLFDEEDAAQALPKAVAAAAKLQKINSEIEIDPIVTDLRAGNIESLLADSHLVLDGTDNFETRFLINDACVKRNLPWIYGGCVGSYGMVLPVFPGETACLTCWLEDRPEPGSTATCDTAGVLNTIASTIAALQGNEAIKFLSGNRAEIFSGLTAIDLWKNSHQTMKVPRRVDCDPCGKGIFSFLEKGEESLATSLCGRDAVQIVPSTTTLNLEELETRLESAGEVSRNDYLLQLRLQENELTLFPDGRAIVKGTNDPSRARSLYAKYVGG